MFLCLDLTCAAGRVVDHRFAFVAGLQRLEKSSHASWVLLRLRKASKGTWSLSSQSHYRCGLTAYLALGGSCHSMTSHVYVPWEFDSTWIGSPNWDCIRYNGYTISGYNRDQRARKKQLGLLLSHPNHPSYSSSIRLSSLTAVLPRKPEQHKNRFYPTSQTSLFYPLLNPVSEKCRAPLEPSSRWCIPGGAG